MMKKVLAVLLAVTLLFSVMAVGFVAFAEGGDTVVTEEAKPDETGAEEGNSNSDMPNWLTNLINRLMEVLQKLLIKFGIKLALKTGGLQ